MLLIAFAHLLASYLVATLPVSTISPSPRLQPRQPPIRYAFALIFFLLKTAFSASLAIHPPMKQDRC
jgi:hypothetical protein